MIPMLARGVAFYFHPSQWSQIICLVKSVTPRSHLSAPLVENYRNGPTAGERSVDPNAANMASGATNAAANSASDC